MPEGFEHLKLKDLDLGGSCPLAKKDETYAILAKIPTLTKLSLSGSDMESLSEGMCDASVIPFLTLCNARRNWRLQGIKNSHPGLRLWRLSKLDIAP